MFAVLRLLAVLAFLLGPAAASAFPLPAPPSAAALPPIAGIAVTPFSEDPGRGLTFDGMVDEIADAGATDLSLVVQWAQATVASNQIRPHPKETQDEAVLRRMMRRARARGLRILLFPIVWVEQRGPGLWRGTLRPENPAQWWASYRAFILHFAELAAEEGAVALSIGSELGSLEGDVGRWRALAADVRGRFAGRLVYSANWDHFESVPFWDAVDVVGLTAYHRLVAAATPEQPSEAELRAAWQRIRTVLHDWQETRLGGRPFLFTEVGYPSMDGAAYQPWEYTVGGTVDVEEQRRCYAAFVETWRGDSALAGVYFWNWWGVGGPADANYTPRGKPAYELMRGFLREVAHRP